LDGLRPDLDDQGRECAVGTCPETRSCFPSECRAGDLLSAHPSSAFLGDECTFPASPHGLRVLEAPAPSSASSKVPSVVPPSGFVEGEREALASVPGSTSFVMTTVRAASDRR
jgi:hypothetical protein